MIIKLNYLLLFALVTTVYSKTQRKVILRNGEFFMQDGIQDNPGWLAKIEYDNRYSETGWDTITVTTNPKGYDMLTSYAAGWLEGNTVPELTYNSWRNTQEGFCKKNGEKLCGKLQSYVTKNIKWLSYQISQYESTSPYWHQVNLIIGQLLGLNTGYNTAAFQDSKNLEPISMEDIFLMNLSGDIDDLASALMQEDTKVTLEDNVKAGNRFANGRCSALIKVLENNTDLLVSQVTWNTYQSMIRMLKKYDFQFRKLPDFNEFIPGRNISFSSYPAYLGSGDDYYQISSGLLTLETTIGNSNPKLWKYVNPVGQVPEWMRVIVANRLATNGKEWADIFKLYNSGTYNNQWMIVDYNKFKPGEPIKSDTLWVVEQLPGKIVSGDQSKVLREQTYWASYNTPFYPEIFNMSGLPAFVDKYGDWFSYEKTPRALIFKRDHSKVVDFESFIKLMRYNDYQNDPLSRCDCTPPYSAENGISSRSDLNPKNGSYPFAALGHRGHGGTDVKATSSSLFNKMMFAAMNSPTYDQQPVFKWSEKDFAKTTPHYMQPDEFKFPLIYTNFL